MLKNVFSNWLGLVLRGVISFLLTPILIHSLGDFTFGLWVLVMSVVDYAGILDLGIRPTLHRFVGRLTGTGDRQGLNEVVATAVGVSSIMGIVVVLLTLASLPIVPRFFSMQGAGAADFRSLLLLLGLNLGVLFPGRVLGAYLCGLQRFDLYNAVDVGTALLRGAAIVVILHFGAGVVGVALVTLVTSVLLLGGNFICVRRVDPQVSMNPRQVTWARARELAAYSFYLLLTTAGDYLRFYTDSIVIARLLSVALITPFSVAGRLMDYFKAVAMGLTGPLMPRMSWLEGQGKSTDLQSVFLRGTRAAALLSLFIGLLLGIDGKALLGIWVGPRFVSSYNLLLVLTVAYVVTLVQYPSNALLYALNRHQALGFWTLAEGAANLVLSIHWARSLGLVGVALGTAVPMVFTALLLQPAYVLWVLKLPVSRYVREGLLRPLGVFGAASVLCVLALRPAVRTGIAGFAVMVAGQVVVFAAATLAFGMEASERQWLRETFGRRIHVFRSWGRATSTPAADTPEHRHPKPVSLLPPPRPILEQFVRWLR